MLHVAILVQDQAAVTALMDAGYSSFDRNSRRWTALDEAIATKHTGITKLLYTHAYAYKKQRMKEKKAQMLLTCNELPNYSVKVQTIPPAFMMPLVFSQSGFHDATSVVSKWLYLSQVWSTFYLSAW